VSRQAGCRWGRWSVHTHRAILSIALCCNIFELFDAEECHDLEGSLKVTETDTIRYSVDRIRVSIRLPYGRILYSFQDVVRYLSKIEIFIIFLSTNKPMVKKMLRIYSRCLPQPSQIPALSGGVNTQSTDGNAISIAERSPCDAG